MSTVSRLYPRCVTQSGLLTLLTLKPIFVSTLLANMLLPLSHIQATISLYAAQSLVSDCIFLDIAVTVTVLHGILPLYFRCVTQPASCRQAVGPTYIFVIFYIFRADILFSHFSYFRFLLDFYHSHAMRHSLFQFRVLCLLFHFICLFVIVPHHHLIQVEIKVLSCPIQWG